MAVEDSMGPRIADFSPCNFERLEAFQQIARETGRELVAMAKDIYMLHNLHCVGGSCSTEGLSIYNEIGDKSRRNGARGSFNLFMATAMWITPDT